MTAPESGLEPFQGGPDVTVVSPSAVSGPAPSAAWDLGQVLTDLVHRSGAYHSESQVDAATAAINRWVSASVPVSAKRALSTGDERAVKEDVTQRVPPGGAVQAIVTPPIDYDRLAQALVRAGVQPSELRGISR